MIRLDKRFDTSNKRLYLIDYGRRSLVRWSDDDTVRIVVRMETSGVVID